MEWCILKEKQKVIDELFRRWVEIVQVIAEIYWVGWNTLVMLQHNPWTQLYLWAEIWITIINMLQCRLSGFCGFFLVFGRILKHSEPWISLPLCDLFSSCCPGDSAERRGSELCTAAHGHGCRHQCQKAGPGEGQGEKERAQKKNSFRISKLQAICHSSTADSLISSNNERHALKTLIWRRLMFGFV